jgi:Flp pilus assembly protein TadD
VRVEKTVALLLLCLPCPAETVNFSKHIAPLLFEYCGSCHRPGETAPFSLLTYADAHRHAAQIVRVTRQRYMPPWLPAPGHGEFASERRLSDNQIALFARWVKDGMLEGDPAQMPQAPKFSEGWQLGQPDVILHMRRPYSLTAEPGDVFRNFILPVGISETKYIRAIELRPGNKRIVHHANLIVDRSRLLRKRDGEDGQPGFPGMEIETEVTGEFDPDSHFLIWKPGTPPLEAPVDMGWKLDSGCDLILNLHLQPSGKPEIVDAQVGLYFAKQPPTRFPMLVQLEHDGALDIPPGAAEFTVTDHLTLPIASDVLAVYPHAHYIGKEIEAWADLPNGERRPLLLIRDWDINWQAVFAYKRPVSLPAGAILSMRVVYDNTAANPRNPSNPPKRIRGGNRSTDEMGHVWFQLLPAPLPGGNDPRLILQQAIMRRRIEKYPADFAAHFNLGAALLTLNEPDEAIPMLSDAVRLKPSNATAHNTLAVALIATERIDEALRELNQSLALDPDYQNARYNLARIHAGQGDTAAALEELNRYLAVVPNDARAHDFAGRLLASAKRLDEALRHFRKAVELQPEDAGFETNLGAALAQTGNLPEAITAFERALKADPSNQIARDNLARARARLGGR